MEKITLTREFTYWHGGFTPNTYGPGEVEVPAEVADSAQQCGAVEEEPAPAQPEAPPQQQAAKPATGKKK